MKNGLYKVEFATPADAGFGVIALNSGKVQGGDSAMYYYGTYSESGSQFTASVEVKRHSSGMLSVFGRDNLTVNLVGTSDGDDAQLTGTSPHVPGVPLKVRLRLLVA